MHSRNCSLASEAATTRLTTPATTKTKALKVGHCPTATSSNTSSPIPRIDDKELPRAPRSFRMGWRFSMTCALICTIVALLCNLVAMIWSSQQHRDNDNNYLFFSGNCTTMKTIDTWIHLGINILSTLLLGASNYALQVLVAPRREDIDKAHVLHKPVDIAVPSITNWSFMTSHRRVLFVILVVTGLPLHLIYNSVVFSTDSFTESQVTIVSSDFLQHEPTTFHLDDPIPQNTTYVNQLWHDAKNGSFATMDIGPCLDLMSDRNKSDYSNIILFTNCDSANRSILDTYILGPEEYVPTLESQYGWPVPFLGSGSDIQANFTYCLMQQTQGRCTVEVIPKLLIIVMICNFLKGATFTYLLFSNIGSEPLLTLGDAVASFLEIPDRCTGRQGGISATDIRRNLVLDIPEGSAPDDNAYGWQQPHRRYFSSVSPFRWMVTLQLFFSYCTFALGFIFFFNVRGELDRTASSASTVFNQQWQAGFGTLFDDLFYQPQISSDPTNSLIANSIIANAPQLILSFIYITCNGLFTNMSISAEWAGYIREKKRGLRVTCPAGQQRSSYWLSLPCKVSVPMLVTFGTLHWLLSQSLYTIRVDYFTAEGVKSDYRVNGLAWSPLMLGISLAVACVVPLALLAFGLQKFPPGIPIVSGNSWAISAGCHAVNPGESLRKLRYGVIGDLGDGTYRVGFSSGIVKPLVPGGYYR